SRTPVTVRPSFYRLVALRSLLPAGGAAAAQSGRVHRTDQVFSRPGHPGPDGADRATADLGGGGVVQPPYLGEYESVPAAGFQPGDQLAEQDALIEPGPALRRMSGHDGVPVLDRRGARPRRAPPDLVGGDPSGDGEQPRASRRAPGEAG